MLSRRPIEHCLLHPSPHWTQLTGISSDGRAGESCGFLIKKSDARS